jgi:hypothetical protein
MRVHHHQERFKGAYTVALIILLILLVGMVGLAGAIRLAQSAAELGPQVGDIVNFDPARRVPRDSPPGLTVNRDGASSCVIDIRTLHRLGGSLVVESRTPRPNRAYRVHWAGKQSAEGTDNCGTSADLTLDDDTLDILAMAAGGFGASNRQPAAGQAWRSGGR